MTTTQPSVSQMMSNYATPVNQTLPGKVINNLQEVRPNEVPIDGSASVFPMSDLSSIYVKAWGPDGNIQTLKFVPDVSASQDMTNQGPSQFDQIMERLDSIEKAMTAYKKPYNNQKFNKPSQEDRKEVVNNG